jgi:hypothetical protein
LVTTIVLVASTGGSSVCDESVEDPSDEAASGGREESETPLSGVESEEELEPQPEIEKSPSENRLTIDIVRRIIVFLMVIKEQMSSASDDACPHMGAADAGFNDEAREEKYCWVIVKSICGVKGVVFGSTRWWAWSARVSVEAAWCPSDEE